MADGIEGDALTDQSHVSLRVLRGVLHNGKNRLAGRTLTNTGNAAEALLCQAVVVEQFNLKCSSNPQRPQQRTQRKSPGTGATEAGSPGGERP